MVHRILSQINFRPLPVCLFMMLLLFYSCIEEIPIETEIFEEALVIEGTITNEDKLHEIKLSRVFALDEEGPFPVSGAIVKVVGEREYLFEETEAGVYTSKEVFAARTGVDYQLEISINGVLYISEPTAITPPGTIEEISAERSIYRGKDGVAITLNNSSSTGDSNFYKFEYEETYKFFANYFKPKDFVLVNGEVEVIEKTQEEYMCFKTEVSQEILIANTNTLSEDRLTDFLVTFIDSEDPKLSQRYSILVKQYVISREAYNYYNFLKDLSVSDNFFSQTQPGFLAGNVRALQSSNEKVIGFFNVSSVSYKRFFFNYEDFYDPNGVRPKMVTNCPVSNPLLENLYNQVELGLVKWYDTPVPINSISPHLVVPANCVDCTRLGTNQIPEFWEE